MFKVGDMVTLRDDLVAGKIYGGVTLLPSMRDDCRGKTLLIKSITPTAHNTYCDVFGSPFTYSVEMFVPVSYYEKELTPVTPEELSALLCMR